MNKKIRYFAIPLFFILIVTLSCTGCMKLAIRTSSELFQNISGSIFEECDPDMAKVAIPSNLKLLEGILKNDPDNPELLKLLSMGFCGYSMLFVEEDNKERASDLYYRATAYGLRAVGLNKNPETINREELETLFKEPDKKGLDSLLWTTVSWSSWINLNLHKPSAIVQLGVVQLCIDKLTEKEPDLFYGLPYLLKGVILSARSPMLGGDYEKSKEYFDKALLSGNRNLFLSQYFYARYYCIGTQNKEMFTSLLTEIINKNKEYPNDLCLLNMVIRIKAETLLNNVDDYFI
ncbi:MAG: TRAP transporter TatT component family protein [Desulfobacteraceae bacterium]|jgi:hypothetical protein